MKLTTITAISLITVSGLALGVETAGTIESVTVYRGQALVTRRIDASKLAANAPADAGGVREIVVTDLPARIRPESLHAEAEKGLTVRSVRFRTRPVVQDTREEVRKLDDQIAQLQDQLDANKRHADLLTEHRAYLMSLQTFVAPTATVEMSKGVLNADTLQKLSIFLQTSRDDLTTRELALTREARDLRKGLQQAQREREKVTSGSSRTVYEAVVLVSSDGNAGAPMHLRYVVDGATWSPSYTLRAGGTPGGQASESAITLDYYASIQQMSGEDWTNVTMTLSTATPSLVARAPMLEPMPITLGVPAQEAVRLSYADAKNDLREKRKDLENLRAQNRPAGPAGGGGEQRQLAVQTEEFDKGLNKVANDDQVLDLLAGVKVERGGGNMISPPAPTEGLSVTYSIPGGTSLPSRSDTQQVRITSVPVKAQFVKIASPVLTSYVYDQARAINTSTMVLLAGPSTAYADGSFVGTGELPTVSAGQDFTAGFGIDSALSTRRELVDRTETIQGGNKVVTLTYRLSIDNFGAAPVNVRLMDRLPKPERGTDLRVTMMNTSAELSGDEEYQKGLKKEGILRWDVSVPAQATGLSAFSVEYSFKLEYDKQMSLMGM